MNNKIFKYIKYLSYLLMGLGVAVLVYFLVASLTNTTPYAGYPKASEGAASGANLMLIYAYILVAITIFVAIIFPIINIIKNPKGSMRSLLGILLMVVVLGVSYLVSSSEPMTLSDGAVVDSVSTLKLADMGLYAAYVMLAVAFLAILFGELKNALKK